MSQFQLFRNVVHIQQSVRIQILQKPVAKHARGVSEYLPMNEDTGEQLLGL
jgi:hypothetical protein